MASPTGIAVDRNAIIYVANGGTLSCAGEVGHDVVVLGPPAIGFPESSGSINLYAPGSDGDVAPIATIRGPHTQLGSPQAIAIDPSGNIYVVNDTNEGCADVNGGRGGEGGSKKLRGIYLAPGIFDLERIASSILVFAAGSNGDVTPIATIGGAFTGMSFPSGIAIGNVIP